MSKRNKKQHAGTNQRKQARQEERRRLKSLQDLAGTIIEKEEVPEEKPSKQFDPNSIVNEIIKDSKK